MRVALLVPLVAGLGCAAGPMPGWHDSLDVAIREAKAADTPLLVLSIVGDLRKRC